MQLLKNSIFIGAIVLGTSVFGVQRFVYDDEGIVMPLKHIKTLDSAFTLHDTIYITDIISEHTPLLPVGQEFTTRLVLPNKIETHAYIVESDTKFKQQKGNKKADTLLRRTILTIKGSESFFGRKVKVVELWQRRLPETWLFDSIIYTTDNDEYRYWAPIKYASYASLLTGLVATVGGFTKIA